MCQSHRASLYCVSRAQNLHVVWHALNAKTASSSTTTFPSHPECGLRSKHTTTTAMPLPISHISSFLSSHIQYVCGPNTYSSLVNISFSGTVVYHKCQFERDLLGFSPEIFTHYSFVHVKLQTTLWAFIYFILAIIFCLFCGIFCHGIIIVVCSSMPKTRLSTSSSSSFGCFYPLYSVSCCCNQQTILLFIPMVDIKRKKIEEEGSNG